MKNELIKKLQEIVKELTQEEIKIEISRSNDSSHGDWTSNIALRLSKVLGKNPMEVAEEIATAFGSFEGIEKVEAVRPGFINFYLSPNYLLKKVGKVAKGEFSFENIGQDRAAVVEYSSPNIAKPFTIGHLRSTIIGDAIANILQAVGYNVYRDNHLGDWGSQFGKQIYAIKNIPLRVYPQGADIGEENEKVLDSSSNPIKNLVSLYVKFHELAEAENPSTGSGQNQMEEEGRKWFKKLEDGDEEARRLWKKCIDWSFKEFDRIYGELGVPSAAGKAFENNGRGFGESYFEDKMGPVIEELQEKNLLKESKGAQMVFYPDDVLPPLMILKQDGATLYATRDLATDKFRLEKYGKDVLIVNEVGAEQSLYFKQLFMLEEMLGWYQKGQRVHVGHGLFRFKEGKMSTRKGNVIWLQEVLEEAEKRARGLMKDQAQERWEKLNVGNQVGIRDFGQSWKGLSLEEVSKEQNKITKQVAMGALKWNDLKRSSHLDVTFDWDEVLNMQGNSGPYIQYSYVRTKSILEKAGVILNEVKDLKDSSVSPQNDKYTLNTEELAVLRHLDKFAEIVEQAATTYSPNVVANYLFELAQLFNNFYQKHRIVNAATDEEKNFRLGLTQATGNVLKKGLELLGIIAPEKM